MKITKIEIRKVKNEGSKLRGVASVVIDDSFAVNRIRIIEGDKGLFIAMPSVKTATGGYSDIAHPINSKTRKLFEEAIIGAYNETE